MSYTSILTIRLSKHETELLDNIKIALNEPTSSGAIRKLIAKHSETAEHLEQLSTEVAELQYLESDLIVMMQHFSRLYAHGQKKANDT